MKRLAILGSMLAFAAPALASGWSTDYVAIEPRNCAPSIERWKQIHADGGRKILEEQQQFGAFAAYRVRWDDGTVWDVTVGPSEDADGSPAMCIVARRNVPAQS